MNIKHTIFSLSALSGLLAFQPVATAPSDVPIFLVSGVESQVMINMSNDHQLFYKAYDDWSDVDPVADGIADTTYKHSIDYYGYFDPYKCYNYSSSRFIPQAVTPTKYCAGNWSGNFLNWASMTRMDTVRKTLYGGYRSTDTASQTILERAFLPSDAHSFAKYYADATGEIAKLTPWNVTEITLCSTTYGTTGDSQNNTNPPLIRIAEGNFALWAANERWQCHWDGNGEAQGSRTSPYTGNSENNGNWPPVSGLNASPDNPHWTNDRLGSGDYIVRVEACVAGLVGTEKCRFYPTSTKPKPIGLLQEYGEDEDIHFGLITGSYAKNKSGGTLRKNIGPITDEINHTTDGTFKTPPAAGNIIGTLDALRISRYCYNCSDAGTYNQSDSCRWGNNSFSDGNCANWGNPQSEMYLESLRYFAGASQDFAANDSSYIPALSGRSALGTATWADPLNNTNYCAPVKIIHFNASVSSYDVNQLGGASDLDGLSGASSVHAWTDEVGAASGEGIAGNDYFIGEGSSSTTTDGLCTAKTLNDLSDAEGICPEAPRLEAGFDIAGLAFYAHKKLKWDSASGQYVVRNSIRNDLTDTQGNTADINVETFGVTLAPAVPKVEVPVPNSNKVVTILPACRNEDIDGNCAIVDFKIVQPHTQDPANPGEYTGWFYVNWEDSEQGGDYDQDMAGILKYRVTSSQITVSTAAFAQSTGFDMGFGYIISGTTQDGFHVHSGINGYDEYFDPTGVDECGRDTTCNRSSIETSWTYTIGTSSGELLKDPLYYAAKWGGFKEEEDPAQRPPLTADPNGIPDQTYEWDADGDGQPDNYFFARNPGQLNEKVAKVFQAIATVTSSASVVANSVSLQTTTRIYQARFDSADWSGKLLSFPVTIATGALQTPEWDASEEIRDQNTVSGTWNSSNPASNTWNSTGRNWITWNNGGVAFRWGNLSTAQQTALSTNPDAPVTIPPTTDALGPARLNYLRGDFSNELRFGVGSFRNRGTPLSDVVHSTPTVVAAPAFGYRDTIPGTATAFTTIPYSQFKTEYGDSECVNSSGTAITSWTAGTSGSAGGREPMLYFGSNGGAMHAVSACTGVERLAYVPETLYPKLGRLTSPSYSHTYFVDGPATVVDAFFDDGSGSDAWHTVLLGTLRGGGKGIFALNVTDPNTFNESGANPAKVALWEKNSGDTGYGDLGYTFSQPAIIKAEGHGWVAVFGNGYHSGNGSNSKAVLYIADISDGTILQAIDLSTKTGHGPTPNGLSAPSPIDVDGDGDVDIIYAGDLNGNVWRFAATTGTGFSAANTTLMYTATNASGVRQPITSRIAVGLHPYSAVGRVLYFGTGKYYELADQDPANAVQYNTQYGIWDRDVGSNIASGVFTVSSSNTVPTVGTRNSTRLQQQTITTQQVGTFGSNSYEIRVVSNTSVNWATPAGNCDTYNASTGDGACGWYIDLTDTGEKMVSNTILRGGRLIFVTTIPSLVPCEAGGTGWLMEIDPRTGGRMDIPVFDLNGDGVFDYKDNLATAGAGGSTVYTPVSGKKSKVGILQPPAILSGVGGSGDGSYGGAEGKYASGTKNAQIELTIENPDLLGAGRKSWTRIK